MQNKNCKFKVGNRVICQFSYSPFYKKIGTIKRIERDESICVEFDERNPWGHSCANVCEDKRGWYCSSKHLELISEKKEKYPYKLIVLSDGVETTVKEIRHGKVVSEAMSKCHKDDAFDFKTGAKLAIKRVFGEDDTKDEPKNKDSINIGDIVRVVDPDYGYGTYVEWIQKNAPDNVVYYAYHDIVPKDTSLRYRVIAKAPHGRIKSMLYYIEECNTCRCFLMDERGIEKCVCERT